MHITDVRGDVHAERLAREPFEGLQADVRSFLPQAHPVYLRGLQAFHRDLDISGDLLLDTSLVLLDLPASLDDLQEHLVRSTQEAAESLKSTWVLRVLKELDDVAGALRPSGEGGGVGCALWP